MPIPRGMRTRRGQTSDQQDEMTHEVVEVAVVDAVVQNSIPGLAGRECRGFTRVSLSNKRRYVQRERLIEVPRQKIFLVSLRKPKLEHHST